MDEPTDPDPPPPRARRADRRRRGRAEGVARGGAAVADRRGGRGPGRGARSAARRSRRRRSLVRTGLIATVLGLLGVVLLVAAAGLVERPGERDVAEDVPAAAQGPGDRQPTLAVVTHLGEEGEGALSIAILAVDRATGAGTVLLVPPSTVADVPGHGSFAVGQAFAFGGPALAGVTLENLLGIRLDQVVGLSREDWAALLERVDGFPVEVSRELVAPDGEGGEQVRFSPGRQHLDGARLAEYLTIRRDGETELDMLPRVQRVLTGLLDRIVEQPSALEAVFADDAPMLGATDPALVEALLDELAAARADDRVVALTLPVSPLGSGRDDAYRVDGERLGQLVEERLAASRPDGEAGSGRSLQILNGNGVPGIGQEVAQRLQPGGYRVLLTGNADHFDHETTRIVVHGDDASQLAVARDIRERLGAGEVERSGIPQSVVDVTIVVGADLVGDDVPEGVPPLPDGDDAGDEAAVRG